MNVILKERVKELLNRILNKELFDEEGGKDRIVEKFLEMY